MTATNVLTSIIPKLKENN